MGINRITDWIADRGFVQFLRGKWDELDPQSKSNLRIGLLGISILFIIVVMIGSTWKVHKLKKEVSEKTELLSMIQNANEEMRKLKESAQGVAVGGRPGEQSDAPWPAYFESMATSSGIDKANLVVSSEKPGNSSDMARESLYDITVKHSNIKQIVRFAFFAENGARPVKLRNLSIDTKNDPSGYMDATLSLSAFSLKQSEK